MLSSLCEFWLLFFLLLKMPLLLPLYLLSVTDAVFRWYTELLQAALIFTLDKLHGVLKSYTEKVLFNIARVQKFIKSAKNGQIFENLKCDIFKWISNNMN